jgi:prepilin-type N-terminal cleavage/methylation domain-containing protein
MNRQKGFSLIELLIVVAIILIIAAIAIPNLLRSRMAANEASAVGSLRTMNTALVTYSSTYVAIGFPAVIADLKPGNPPTATAADLLDDVLSCTAAGMPPCNKSGYNFTYTVVGPVPNSDYKATANPITYNRSGLRSFFTDASGVVRGADKGGAACDNTCAPL